MTITIKNKWANTPVARSLTSLIEDTLYCYDNGVTENVSAKATESIKFTEKLIDLLYAKGLLNDSDILSLISNHIDAEQETVTSIK